MSIDTDRLPFDGMMCFQQLADAVGFVAQMQGHEVTEEACRDAERMCDEIFSPIWESEDRTRHLITMAYLAMDLAANVSYTLGRAQILSDAGEEES